MRLVKPSYLIQTNIHAGEILAVIEQAGRTCYKSKDKITVDSAAAFAEKIITRGHHSVLEHVSISVKFVIDRGVSHELVQHRLCAFSQESTRYCNYSGGVTFVIPPWVESVSPGEWKTQADWQPGALATWPASDLQWAVALWRCEYTYLNLLQAGWSPQQARSVLSNSLKTEVVCTANIREWRHILTLCTSAAAHPQIREVMVPLLHELTGRLPQLFQDIE